MALSIVSIIGVFIILVVYYYRFKKYYEQKQK